MKNSCSKSSKFLVNFILCLHGPHNSKKKLLGCTCDPIVVSYTCDLVEVGFNSEPDVAPSFRVLSKRSVFYLVAKLRNRKTTWLPTLGFQEGVSKNYGRLNLEIGKLLELIL